MSEDHEHEIKENLIEELESLHNSLSSAAENSSTSDVGTKAGRGAGGGSGKSIDENGIPLLVDIISWGNAEMAGGEIKQKNTDADESSDPVSTIYQQALTPQKGRNNRRFDMSMIPTLYPEQPVQDGRFDSQVDELVDELVTEYLPILEQKLRTKLRQRLEAQNKTH